VQLQEQLTLLDVVALMNQQLQNRGSNRSMSFEIVDGFDFAVGGNYAADVSALGSSGAHRNDLAARHERGQQDYAHHDASRPNQPAMAVPKAGVVTGPCHVTVCCLLL